MRWHKDPGTLVQVANCPQWTPHHTLTNIVQDFCLVKAKNATESFMESMLSGHVGLHDADAEWE